MKIILLFTIAIRFTMGGYEGCKTPVEFRNTDNASLVIGGMFPVHYWSSKHEYVLNEPGLLWVEAMRFAVDAINNSTELLPGVKLGYRIQDSCNDVTLAVHSALQLTQNFLNGTCSCDDEYTNRAIAVVGDASSSTSTRVAAVLSATSTPQISYSSTSTDLNAKHLYPSFMRTLPPDDVQAVLIRDLMVHNRWMYVNIVACDDQYGRVGINELLPQLKNAGVCIAVQAVCDIKNDSNGAKTDGVIAKLLEERQATVIVLWCQRPEAMKVLWAAHKLKLYNRTWIATEAYGYTTSVRNMDRRVVEGMIGVVPFKDYHELFMEKLKRTASAISQGNPWMREYWSKRNCTETNPCKENVFLADLPTNKHVQVIDAVYSIAHGIHAYLARNQLSDVTPKKLLDYVKNVSFISKGKHNFVVSYDKQGNPMVAAYSLTNLRYSEGKNNTWQSIGSWNYISRHIEFTTTPIVYNGGKTKAPKSHCRETCAPGWYALSFGKLCCRRCVKCPKGSVQANKDAEVCVVCPQYMLTNVNRTACIVPVTDNIEITSKVGVLLLNFTTLAGALVLVTIVMFHLNRNKPFLKATNINLSLLQLFSGLFIYALPAFIFYNSITVYTCSGQLLYFVCFYTIAMSVTFTKADRLLRIFRLSLRGHLSSGSHVKTNRVQFITVATLTLIALVAGLTLCLAFPITVDTQVTHQQNDVIIMTRHCSGNYDTILFCFIGYMTAIALICALYAFKARRLPETYNEARNTSLCMFVFMLCWLLYVPLHYSTTVYSRRLVVWAFVSHAAITSLLFINYTSKLRLICCKSFRNKTFRQRRLNGVCTRATFGR